MNYNQQKQNWDFEKRELCEKEIRFFLIDLFISLIFFKIT